MKHGPPVYRQALNVDAIGLSFLRFIDMRKLLLFFVSFSYFTSKAQDTSIVKQITVLIEAINSKSIKTDTCKGIIRGDVYLYTLENNRPIKIVTRYEHIEQFITETFYFRDTTLISCLVRKTPGYLSNFKPVTDKRYYFNDAGLLLVQPTEPEMDKRLSEEIEGMKTRLDKAKRAICRCLNY
jgi:hypothetical protein